MKRRSFYDLIPAAFLLILLASLTSSSLPAHSQEMKVPEVKAPAPKPDIQLHTQPDLAQHEAALLQKALASPTGEAGEKLDDFGSHWLLLMVRARTGESELHQLWADEIVVRSGTVTLIVGGEMTGTHPYNNLPGEFHGTGLTGGTTYVLHPGEIAYVRAGVPHWMQVDAGKPASVLIYKEKD